MKIFIVVVSKGLYADHEIKNDSVFDNIEDANRRCNEITNFHEERRMSEPPYLHIDWVNNRLSPQEEQDFEQWQKEVNESIDFNDATILDFELNVTPEIK